MSAQRRLAAIFQAWTLLVDKDTLHELIIEWLTEYKHLIKNQDLVTEILTRVDTTEVVNDFMCGDRYRVIRSQFLTEKQ